MEATILTVLGLFATVTLWILTSIKSDIKKFEEKTETRFDRIETRLNDVEKGLAIVIETQHHFDQRMDSFDKRMDSITSEMKQMNQNFIDHLHRDHGIRMGKE